MKKFVFWRVNLNTFGVKHKPLLKVNIDHFIPDELHLMLRITDILLRNVILDCKDKDDLDKKESKLNGKNLENFVKLVQDCGFSFIIWTQKGNNELDWTSLSGSDKLKLLKNLPKKLKLKSFKHKPMRKSCITVERFFCIVCFNYKFRQ